MSPNLSAFLAVVRAGEGTSDPRGYHRLFGGEEVEDLSDHPRRRVTRRLRGDKTLTSSAAGAYQSLSKTWDDFTRAVGPRDFSPASQDEFALWCIRRRRALEDVEAGRFESAIAKCALEWASLPGSPYGQPTISMARAREVYEAAGGTYAPTESAAATDTPAPAPQPASAPPGQPAPPSGPAPFVLRGLRELLAGRRRAPDPSPVPLMPEAPMPVPALLAALLPSLIAAAPDLVRVFTDKSKPVSERNQEAAIRVMEIAKEVTEAPNEQAAVEAIEKQPELAATFREAVRDNWFDLYDPEAFQAAEKSRGAARAFAVQMTNGPMWRAVGFGAILFVLAMVTVLGAGWMLRETLLHDGTDQQTRGMIVGALVTWVGIVLAYFFGSSASSRGKDQALTEAARRP